MCKHELRRAMEVKLQLIKTLAHKYLERPDWLRECQINDDSLAIKCGSSKKTWNNYSLSCTSTMDTGL